MPTITTVDAAWTPSPTTFDDAEARRFDTAMFLGDGSNNGVRGGIVRHGDNSLAVTVNGSDQVTVQAGAFVIPAATGLGVYRGALSAATSATALTSRNGTNPRIDLIVVQATSTGAVVKTIDGTPSASPTAPALPAQHIELARVTVPQVAGGAVTVDSTWRSYATSNGGTLPVETSARLPGSGNQKNQRATALDTGLDYRWNGTAWVMLNSPGGTLGYAQVTAPQSGITAQVDLTGLAVTVTVGAGRRIKITGDLYFVTTGANTASFAYIFEGATQLQQRSAVSPVLGIAEFVHVEVVLTPTAGTHTYKLRASSNGTSSSEAAATFPAFILVEDIGGV